MCGIVGYIGTQPAQPLLLQGLKRLEYRGYDSAGMALIGKNGLRLRKKAGKVAAFEELLAAEPADDATLGIAHTRWATHGAPTDRNAHPHVDCSRTIALVHNGTIENHLALRALLERKRHVFASQTDTETLVHLIEKFMGEGHNLMTAVQMMHELVVGAYAIAVVTLRDARELVVASKSSPVVIGLAGHGFFVASDATAVREHTDQVYKLQDGQMAVLQRDGVIQFRTLTNEHVAPELVTLEWDLEQIMKGGYQHFMLKEIHEQPAALRNVLAGRLTRSGTSARVLLGGIEPMRAFLTDGFDRVLITACGTSYHAGLVGKRILEKVLRMPVMVEIASEFATSFTPVDARTLVIVISQSGETKDTIEAAKRARELGAHVWNICNAVGSSLTRVAHAGMYLHIGPEIGVASTKAFTAQVASLVLFALALAQLRQPAWISEADVLDMGEALNALPQQAETLLALDGTIADLAEQYVAASHWLYLGRGYNYPAALEGALKLKEIAYVPAEGYPAGEMKHGPIALINDKPASEDERTPVVIIAPKEAVEPATYGKILSNIAEIEARSGRILLLATEGDEFAEHLQRERKVAHVMHLPVTSHAFCTPILASIPLQLLAYHVARLRGCHIDQPRNLAKSVTVE